MAKFMKGDVVVVPFPFSDLTQAKKRPALVIAVLEGNDLILCQITSQISKDRYVIAINDEDFQTGSLRQLSNVRPNRVFTADNNIVLYKVGNLKQEKTAQIVNRIVEILKQ